MRLTNKKLAEGVGGELSVHALFVVQSVLTYKYNLSLTPFVDENTIQVLQPHKAGYTIMSELLPMLDLANEFLWLADIQENKKETHVRGQRPLLAPSRTGNRLQNSLAHEGLKDST